MKASIKYRIDFDFITYIHTCANIKDMKKMSNLEMKQHPAISNKELKQSYDVYYKDAEIFYHDDLSYIQRNELDMFFHKVSIFSDYLMMLSFKDMELKDQLQEDFKAYILKVSELSEDQLTLKHLVKSLKNHYDEPNAFDDYQKEAELVLEMLKDTRMFNSIFKNAIESLKQTFIEKKYKPNKETFDKKLAEHNEKYQKNPIEFMMNISSGMLKEAELKKADYQPYITYYAPFRLLISIKHEKSRIIYNYELEKMCYEDYEKDLLQSFLKFLSDPKRYQMLQMLKKEKWYANELAKKFKITPATMSYHINKLYGLGLITFEPGEQNKLFIELDRERMKYLIDLITKDLM